MHQRAYKLTQQFEIHLEVQCVCVNKHFLEDWLVYPFI